MKQLFILSLFLFFITPVFAIDNSSVIKSDNKTTNAASVNWVPYMKAVEAKVKRNWHPPRQDISKRVVALFKVNKDGTLAGAKITQSSGIVEYDKAALQAVQMSSPFEALPSEFNGKSIEIDFTFDYNILGNNTKKFSAPIEELKMAVTNNPQEAVFLNSIQAIEKQYIYDAKQKVIQKWHPKTYYSYYKTREANNLSAEITINKNGELVNHKIVNSAQSKDAEKRVLEAIEKAAPFAPFPEDIQKESLKFTIRFIY